MKVIRELIHYFTETSLLTDEDLRQLRLDGWTSLTDECPGVHFNSDGSIVRPQDTDEEDDDVFSTEDAAEPDLTPPPAGIPRHGHRPKVRTAKAPELEAWLAERLPDWRPRLAPLEVMGDWRALRHLTPAEAHHAIQTALDARRLDWSELWAGLLMEEYREWFGQSHARGPATQAFRALLVVTHESEATSYRWLLRYPAIAEIALYALVRGALLRGMQHWLETAPDSLTTWIHRGKSLAGLLTLALAERLCGRGGALEFPHRPLPPFGSRVWALNAVSTMNPRGSSERLSEGRLPVGKIIVAETYEELELQCPVTWRLGVTIPMAVAVDFKPPRIPCRVLIDGEMPEIDVPHFLEHAEEVAGVTSEFGVTGFALIPNHSMSIWEDAYYVQITAFSDSPSRRLFVPGQFEERLAEVTGLTIRAGVAPCFHAMRTVTRREVVI